MIQMILLAIAFIYMIMVAQFQSLLSPFIVMFTIPLAFTGGFLGLLITGQELSIVAMLGFLVLCGVVVNNGIVFIDYDNQLKERGYATREAIIETGRTRLRPILMTALTTILAMTTMALGIGTGSDMMQGMAIVTIGGLTYSTVLTLFVVPIMIEVTKPPQGPQKAKGRNRRMSEGEDSGLSRRDQPGAWQGRSLNELKVSEIAEASGIGKGHLL